MSTLVVSFALLECESISYQPSCSLNRNSIIWAQKCFLKNIILFITWIAEQVVLRGYTAKTWDNITILGCDTSTTHGPWLALDENVGM